MKLVTDANILFSAFVKGGLTRKIWFERRLELYAPIRLFEEYRKYAAEMKEKSKLSEEESASLTLLLFGRVRIVGKPEIIPYLPAAEHLTSDTKDAPYIACALTVGAEIWSNDPHLKQPRIRCWSTRELAEELGYLK